MDYVVPDRISISIYDKELIAKLVELKNKLGVRTWAGVVEYLIKVYEGKGSNVSNTSNVNTKPNPTPQPILNIEDEPEESNEESDVFMNDLDFNALLDTIKTLKNKGVSEGEIVREVKEWIGNLMLTSKQYDKLIKEVSFLRYHLVYTGKGYKVKS